jgi:hypothetical protein
MKNDSLKTYRRRLAATESALAKARDLMRAAAKRKGLDTAGIFSETLFVERKAAHRWESEAYHQGESNGLNVGLKILKDSKSDAGPHIGSFSHLARNPSAAGAPPADAPPETASKPRLVVDNQRPAATTCDDGAA